MSIESRLRRLEERRSAGRCPECGLAPDEPRALAVIDEEHPEKSFDGDPDERCARCGRALWCVIEIVYDSPGDAGGEGLS